MEAVPGAIGLSPSKVVPRGLGTGEVESFSGYAARMSARIAVPTPTFVRRAFRDAQGGEGLSLWSAVVAAARRLNVGERDSAVAAAVGRLTGHNPRARPSGCPCPDPRRLRFPRSGPAVAGLTPAPQACASFA